MRQIFLMGAILSLLAAPSIAGSLGFTQIRGYMDWEPDCYRPSSPSFYVHDVDSYNWAVDDFNTYLAEVEDYLSCISGEAEDDMRTISSVISNSLDDLQSDIIDEVEGTRRDLENQRVFLD